MGSEVIPGGWMRGVRGGDSTVRVIVCGEGGRRRKQARRTGVISVRGVDDASSGARGNEALVG